MNEKCHQVFQGRRNIWVWIFMPMDTMIYTSKVCHLIYICLLLHVQLQYCADAQSLPAGCSTQHGPHDLECLRNIRNTVGCKTTGHNYPDNFTNTELSELNRMTVSQLEVHMQLIHDNAERGDQQAQEDCYGNIFPKGCLSFNGPHSVECLTNIWNSVGCLMDGLKYPESLSVGEQAEFHGWNIQEVRAIMTITFERAHTFDAQAQLDCFGTILPLDCHDIHGPYSMKCKLALWNESGCLLEGYHHPYNLTHEEHHSIDDMDIFTIRRQLRELTDYQQRQAQLECYGLEFPQGCTTYQGNNSLECYQSIWKNVGCIDHGHGYPESLSDLWNSTVLFMNLREVELEFYQIIGHTSVPDTQAQLDCFGLIFPHGCKYYRGEHSLQCQKTIWHDVGCLPEGHKHPTNLTNLENVSVNILDLIQISNHMRDIYILAGTVDAQAQLDCYGIEFPFGCSFYRGNNSLKCYESIWLDAGCTENGYEHPRYLISVQVSMLHGRNLRELKEDFRSVARSATSFNTQAQLDCFGVAFPTGCKYYRGPHSLLCQKSIWKNAGCIREGFDYPDNLTRYMNDSINAMNLVQLELYIENIAKAALSGSVQAQLQCYGLAFPRGCTRYDGPHLTDCYKAIWVKVGCVRQGKKRPDKLSMAEIAMLDLSNLRQVEAHMRMSYFGAYLGQSRAQLDCFGLVFPYGCTSFRGAHSIECMDSIWIESGCLVTGFAYPRNLSSRDLFTVERMDLYTMRRYMESLSVLPKLQMQLDCFGFKFPEGCKSFSGINPIKCYESMWLDAGCIPEGYGYPRELTAAQITFLYNYNLLEIEHYFEHTREHTLFDAQAQLDCFGIIYPRGCRYYNGPHSLQCKISVWNTAGCTAKGHYHPSNISADENDTINQMNLMELEKFMMQKYIDGNSGNKREQLNCFGIEFPKSCHRFRGPNPTSCFESVWKDVGCAIQGYGHPRNLTNTEKVFLNSLDISQIKKFMRRILDRALLGDTLSQLKCFGMSFPSGCTTYHGPHSLPCLEAIWLDVGCMKEGYNYPKKLDRDEIKFWGGLNLRDVRKAFQDVLSSSAAWDAQTQLDCFGTVLPFGCHSFRGPFSRICLKIIWRSVGCTSEGYSYPDNLTAVALKAINSMDFLEVRSHMLRISDWSSEGDTQSQLDCYGLEFADKCMYYRGSNPLGCYTAIWLRVGCTKDGLKYPSNLSHLEKRALHTSNLRQVAIYFEKLFDNARLWNAQAQLDCLGLHFPFGCQSFRGRHSQLCLKTLWKEAGCLSEGHLFADNLTQIGIASFHQLNLLEIRTVMTKFSRMAQGGDVQSQLYCYGFEFPRGCSQYQGIQSLECYQTIWLDVGCTDEGHQQPMNLSETEANFLHTRNLRQLQVYFETIFKRATAWHSRAQLDCFGTTFPLGCQNFRGPFSIRCLETIWEEVGCLRIGRGFPDNLTVVQLSKITEVNLSKVKKTFGDIVQAAKGGDAKSQIDCYGMTFLQVCNSVTARMECLKAIWRNIGCTEEGLKYLQEISASFNETMNYIKLVELHNHILHVYNSATAGNERSQMKCYGMRFPSGCTSYHGPHTLHCYKEIWKSVGCNEKALNWPDKLMAVQMSQLNRLNLREVVTSMEDIFKRANGSDTEAQIDCFGMTV